MLTGTVTATQQLLIQNEQKAHFRCAFCIAIGKILLYNNFKRRDFIMKRILVGLITIMLLLNIVTVFAQEEFTLTMQIGNPIMTVNGETMEIDKGRGTVPITENGRTLVPIRAIIEAMGGTVGWDEVTQKVTLIYGSDNIILTLNSTNAYFNGQLSVLDVAPKEVNGRTILPIRYIAESFKFGVGWEDSTQTITIFKDVELPEKVSYDATQISEKVAPSVFYIEVYDSELQLLGSGSGFFISSDGVAVTNYHVIDDTAFATVETIDGKLFEVTNIIAFDKELDAAIIKVGKTELITGEVVDSFPALTLADSDNIKAGQKIFAIGSPKGLKNTISDGIISNVSREDGRLIQITAPIEHGSSGGALINENGEVLGITSEGYDNGNLNFAIPINLIKPFDLTAEGMTYAEFVENSHQFVLAASPQNVVLEVGQSVDVLVYAEGKGDWSIYWHAYNEDMVECQWGDWLEEAPNVCTLKITAKQPGITAVNIYSDVDFEGMDITVNIKNPTISTYPGFVDVPTFTSVTGVEASDIKENEDGYTYTYKCYNADKVIEYTSFLYDNGFLLYSEGEEEYGYRYAFITPGNRLVTIFWANRHHEVLVTVFDTTY